jgi:hypothetical protein
MQIKIAKGEFHIPNDFELEIDEVNPLLSQRGSRSVPVSLPGSVHNLFLLDNPERIAKKNKFKTEYQAVVQHDSFRKTGKQVIFSASKDGIETAFYFKEGDFYEQIKNVTMQDIFSQITLQKDSIQGLISYLDSVMKGSISENFSVFPVVTQFDMNDEYTDEEEYVRYRMNDVCPSKTHVINNVVDNMLTDSDEYEDIETPEGYGITVFPKLGWVLDVIFQYFGMDLQPSVWHSDPDFSGLVLLNSTADAIVKGLLNFADVVPNCKVNEFLDCICKKFNCAYEINIEKGSAGFIFLDEVLSSRTNLKDITPFLVENLTVSFVEQKKIRLKNAKDFELTSTETSTYAQLLEKYPNMIVSNESNFSTELRNATFRLATGSYYMDVIFKSNYRVRTEWLGSNFFEYSDSKTMAEQIFESPDECVPICRVVTGVSAVTAFTPYVGQRRHLHTVVETDGKEEKESTSDQKIMFVFPNGHGTYTAQHYEGNHSYSTRTEHWYYASQFSYNHLGIKVRQTSLLYNGDDGLYQRFWKNTDNAMQNEYQPLKGVFRFSYKDFFELRFDRLYLLNGQAVIIKSRKYSITKNGIEFKEIELLTV